MQAFRADILKMSTDGFTSSMVGPDPGAGSEAGPAPVSAFPSSRPHRSVPRLLWARTAQLHPRVYLIVK